MNAPNTLTELLPSVSALRHEDKLRLLRYLADELCQEARLASLIPDGAELPIWSPYEAHEAAGILSEAIRKGTGDS